MQRVVIMGSPGSGKSGFARQLAAVTGLALIHLDQHFFLPNWVERDRDEWKKLHASLIAADSWVIDGGYGQTAAERIKRADLVIWFDLPTHVCLFRVLKRIVGGFGRVRADSAPGCREKFNLEFLLYVLNFKRERFARLMRIIAARPKNTTLVIIRNNVDLDSLLQGIETAQNAQTEFFAHRTL